jgi:type IV pilus assembly protein PilF
MKTILTGAVAILLAGCASSPPGSGTGPGENAATYNAQLGIEYLRQGNLAVAKEKLERAVLQAPRDPHIHDALALLYERINKPELVDKHYRMAAKLAPQDPGILNNYAVYLCKTGRTDEGVKRFNEAANNPLYETPETAYTNAGVCLRAANRLDEARNNFVRAVKVRPNSAEATYQLVDLDMSQGRTAEARARVEGYLSSFDATPDLLLIGVRSAHALGDRLAAERYARRLRVEFPGSKQVNAIPDLSRNPS